MCVYIVLQGHVCPYKVLPEQHLCHCVQVSFIHYATPSEIKQGINDQFSDTFPHIKITLSKLRRIKEDVLNIATEVSKHSST